MSKFEGWGLTLVAYKSVILQKSSIANLSLWILRSFQTRFIKKHPSKRLLLEQE